MKIKNRSELAHVLGMAFSGYANQLQNWRNLQPYMRFLEGEESVAVKIRLNGGTLQVEEIDLDGIKAEVVYLEGKVKERDKEITSLNVLLEEQTKKEEEILAKAGVVTLPVEEPMLEAAKQPEPSQVDEESLIIDEKPEKKKRKRKQK